MNIYYRAAIILALAAALVAGYWAIYKKGERAGAAAVQQAWGAETARRAARIVEAQATARAVEQRLLTRVVELERKKHATTSAIAAAHTAELDRLRNRPEMRAADRPGEPASPPTAGVGCTGAGLAKPDAGFLAGFSADAARLQAEFDRCAAAYGEAVKSSIFQR